MAGSRDALLGLLLLRHKESVVRYVKGNSFIYMLEPVIFVLRMVYDMTLFMFAGHTENLL